MRKTSLLFGGTAAALLLAASVPAYDYPSTLPYYEDLNDFSMRLFTGHFDQQDTFANGLITQPSGKLRIDGIGGGTQTLTATANVPETIDVEYKLNITAANPGGFISFGLGHTTASGTQVDLDVYESGGQYFLGVYDAVTGGYDGTDVALTGFALGTEYQVTATSDGSIIDLEMTTLDGLTTIGTTSRDVSTTVTTSYAGFPSLKVDNMTAEFDDIVVVENTGTVTALTDSFDFTDINLQNWYAEPNADGAFGMNIYNMAEIWTGNSRPDMFFNPGYLTVRGGPALPADQYSRVTTRANGVEYPYYGDVDVAVLLSMDTGAQFSVGTDNTTNEGARYGLVVDSNTTGTNNGVANPSIHLLNAVQLLGFGDGGTAAFDFSGAVASASVGAGWDPTTTEVWLHLQRSGSTIDAFISDSLGGTPIGNSITGATLGAPNAAGQITLTAHRGITRVNEIAIWAHDPSQTWALPPAATEARDWHLLD